MRRRQQPAAASRPELTLLHSSVINSTRGEVGPILAELADVGRECQTFLSSLLGTEAYASPEFETSRMHAQMLWMLLSATFAEQAAVVGQEAC